MTPNLPIAHIAANQNQKEVTCNSAFDDIVLVVTDSFSIDVSGNSDITPAPVDVLLEYTLVLTGVLTGNIALILPTNKRQWRIVHNASDPSIGACTVTAKCDGQPGVVIYPGEARVLYCDGTDIVENDSKAGAAPTIVAVPLSASSPGEVGQEAADSSFYYRCVAPNTWVRAALGTW